ncbi:MAG: hypothetical protein ACOC4F_03045 [bacterium]
MYDHSYVPADANGPEVFISGTIKPVKLQPRVSWIYLEVERGGLRCLLIRGSEAS